MIGIILLIIVENIFISSYSYLFISAFISLSEQEIILFNKGGWAKFCRILPASTSRAGKTLPNSSLFRPLTLHSFDAWLTQIRSEWARVTKKVRKSRCKKQSCQFAKFPFIRQSVDRIVWICMTQDGGEGGGRGAPDVQERVRYMTHCQMFQVCMTCFRRKSTVWPEKLISSKKNT